MIKIELTVNSSYVKEIQEAITPYCTIAKKESTGNLFTPEEDAFKTTMLVRVFSTTDALELGRIIGSLGENEVNYSIVE